MLKPEQGPGHRAMLAIKPKQVPKDAIAALRGPTCCGCDKCLAKAIAAAINAWPGMMEHKIQVPDNSDEVLCVLKTVVGLMLPLTETDDEPR